MNLCGGCKKAPVCQWRTSTRPVHVCLYYLPDTQKSSDIVLENLNKIEDLIHWGDPSPYPAKKEASMQDIIKLAEDHWKYVESMLELHKVDDTTIDIIGWHYRSAMVHGYKHGVESCQ